MEFASERSEDGGCGLNKEEEKKSEHSVGDDVDESSHKQDTIVKEPPIANAEISMVETGPSASPSMKEEEVDDELEIAKTQMGEVREENERLKMSLNKIMNEYRTLEMQFQDIVKQDQTKKKNADDEGNDTNNHQEIIMEESDVSLSLGRVPSNNQRNVKVSKPLKKDEEFNDEDLTLGLECKIETSKSAGSTPEAAAAMPNPSPVNSCEVLPKESEEAAETSPPQPQPPTTKAPLKTMRALEEEVAQQTHAKKARVCVRARCDTPTMNDGCQWRKYGQKISKGNPCPRAYYRCTVAPSCPVRKQVQRCAEDMSILITTYEGTHNHTLPHSATAMASTTSAAASMLLSGSSTSHSGSLPSTTNNNLNFYLSPDGFKSKQQLHHISNPSHHDHPTITLDLTSSNPNGPNSSLSSPFVRFNSNQLRYPSSTSLSFGSSSESNNAMSWPNNAFLNYGNRSNNMFSSVNFGNRQTAENIYQSYMQKSNNSNSVPPPQLPDTVSAATKAITAHPNFQSALAAALTTFIGSNGGAQGNNLGQKMTTWAELFPAAASSAALPSTSKASASSFLNKTTSSSLPFSNSKSASASPGDSNGNTD